MVSRKSQCDAKLEKGEGENRGPDEERARAKATWRRVETLVAPFPRSTLYVPSRRVGEGGGGREKKEDERRKRRGPASKQA